jgi:hypothetical protein
MKKKLFNFILFVIPVFITAQKSEIVFLDEQNKEPIIGLQIFSQNGSFIAHTNSKGVFEWDINILQQGGVKNIVAYNTNYFSLEYSIKEIPSVIYLKKNETVQMDDIIITASKPSKYFTVKAYFRSWQLSDGELTKYGDGLVNYHVPYAVVDDNFNTGIKSSFSAFRTFNGDAIKQKSRIISVSSRDNYLAVSRVPKNDLLKRSPNYNVKLPREDFGTVYEDNKEIGFVIYDQNKNVIEINVNEAFDESGSKKVLFWKFSGKSTQIEKWTGDSNTRRPSYLFANSKKSVEKKGKYTHIETVTEIFIEDTIIDGKEKPENSKKHIDRDRSFYNSNYWAELLIKYPLPSEIKSQLTIVNENKNTY